MGGMGGGPVWAMDEAQTAPNSNKPRAVFDKEGIKSSNGSLVMLLGEGDGACQLAAHSCQSAHVLEERVLRLRGGHLPEAFLLHCILVDKPLGELLQAP